MDAPTCGNCRFKLYDSCHRYPPTPDPSHTGPPGSPGAYSYPVTYAWDWCGEHQPVIKENPQCA